MLKLLRRLFAPLLRAQYAAWSRQKTPAPARVLADSHSCPRCTEPLPYHPLKSYYFCPLCGQRVEYPPFGEGYALTVITKTEQTYFTRLHQAAVQISDTLEGSGIR